ncbi:MAG: hypothetical protein J0I12_05855 [Candidatus Eremiobacteraeota bacterium]|nr:hypothetical protein [Candidatus Eremiobacteraeota bacterium]
MSAVNTVSGPQQIQQTSRPATQATQSVAAFASQKADKTLGKQVDMRPVMDAKAAPEATDKKEIAQRQTEFVQGMNDAGIKASNPPTQDQLKAYFKTFNSDDKREKALDEFENYSNAFHTHTAEVKGHEKDDIKYSKETTFLYGGKMYDSKKEAQAAAKEAGDDRPTINGVNTADASKWSDVDSKKAYNGRKIQDCEGFAYMSGELLGAAGYNVQQSSNADTSNNNGHAMTVLTDPKTNKTYVTSNNKAFKGGTQQELLEKGYDYATGGEHTAGKFYVSDTQAHAQTLDYVGNGGTFH